MPTANTVRRYTTQDSLRHWTPLKNPRGYHGDAILNALGTGKCLVSGEVWNGLKHYVDAYRAALEPIISGYTVGHVLSAEPTPPTLDMGRRWMGDLHDRLSAANDRDGDTDVSEVMQAVENLHQSLGTRNPATIGDALRRLTRARDSVRSSNAQTSARDAIKPDNAGIGRMQISSDAMWSKLNSKHRATADASVAVELRDDLHAASHAKTPYDQLAAMAALNKAFWSRR